MTHDYKRNGTTTLFAALETLVSCPLNVFTFWVGRGIMEYDATAASKGVVTF